MFYLVYVIYKERSLDKTNFVFWINPCILTQKLNKILKKI